MGFLSTLAVGAIVTVSTGTSSAAVAALSRSVYGLESGLSKLGSGLNAVTGMLGKFAIAGAAVTYGVGRAVGMAATFEAAMSGVKSVGELSGQEFDLLKQKAIALGSEGSFGPAEIAGAMEEMRRAGFTNQEVLDGISSIAHVAAADEMSLAQATDIVGNAFRGANDPMLTFAHTGDALAKASADTNTNIRELGLALSYVGPIAGQLHVPFDQTVAAISMISNLGLKGSKAGRGLGSVLQSLAAPTDKAAGLMDKYGIHIVRAADGSTDLLATIRSLRQGLDKIADPTGRVGLAKELFGRDQAKVALAMAQLTTSIDKEAVALKGAEGAAAAMAATRLDNLIGQFKKLYATVESFAIGVFSPLLVQMKDGVAGVTEFFKQVNEGLGGEVTTFAQGVGWGIALSIRAIGESIDYVSNALLGLSATWSGVFGPEAGVVVGVLAVAMTGLVIALTPVALMLIPVLGLISMVGGEMIIVFAVMGALATWLVEAVVVAMLLLKASSASLGDVFAYLGGMWDAFVAGLTDDAGSNHANHLANAFANMSLYVGSLKVAWGNFMDALRIGLLTFLPNWKDFANSLGSFIGHMLELVSLILFVSTAAVNMGALVLKYVVAPIVAAVQMLLAMILGLVQAIMEMVRPLLDLKAKQDSWFSDQAKAAGYDPGSITNPNPNPGESADEYWDRTHGFMSKVKAALTPPSTQVDYLDMNAAEGKAKAQSPAEANVKLSTEDMMKCLHIKTDLNLDGRKMARVQKDVEMNLTERSGFSVDPWQKRQVLERGATVLQ